MSRLPKALAKNCFSEFKFKYSTRPKIKFKKQTLFKIFQNEKVSE